MPAPLCLFSLDFELRIWVSSLDDWPTVRSAVLIAVHAALSREGIEIPFPQRDLHLRSVDDEAVRALKALPSASPKLEV